MWPLAAWSIESALIPRAIEVAHEVFVAMTSSGRVGVGVCVSSEGACSRANESDPLRVEVSRGVFIPLRWRDRCV